jgi:hypothetical protein
MVTPMVLGGGVGEILNIARLNVRNIPVAHVRFRTSRPEPPQSGD